MIAPPWLSVPPTGYGGIEEVLFGLLRGLKKLGVEAELFSIATSKVRGVKVNSFFKEEAYQHIHRPIYESSPITIAHIMYSLQTIRIDRRFDIIHDHNGFIGPLALNYFTQTSGNPPAIHTYHGPPFSSPKQMKKSGLPDNRDFWKHISRNNRLYVVGISQSLMRGSPPALRGRTLPVVYNGIDVDLFPFQPKKQKHFITMARFSAEKGQHVAARICDELGYSLEMAGNIAGINTPRQIVLELANPLSDYRAFADFRYFSDKIWPLTVKNRRIRYVGNLSGRRKLRFLANAKALLFPIDWDEPFGLAVIEALACGTPVVAMRRGSMPEIIEHGVNGWLANTEAELKEYMQRVDEINPEACRRSVEKNFSVPVMAQRYLDRYRSVLS
jgi:glycosyltransferase involved in cell wall biosynthesis